MQGNDSASKGYARCVQISYFGITQLHRIHSKYGGRGGTVVKVLCYKSEGR